MKTEADLHRTRLLAELSSAMERECAGLSRSELTVRDGARLRAYQMGTSDQPPVLIINAVGVPVLLVTRLMRELSREFRVVTWDQRGSGMSFQEFRSRNSDYQTFLDDVVDVHSQLIAAPCAVVTVCSGASLAIKSVAQGRLPATALALISPAVRLAPHVPSLYEQTAVPFMREIVKEGTAVAELLISISSEPQNSQAATPDEQVISTADRLFLNAVDSVLIQAHAVTQFYCQAVDNDVERVPADALVLATRDDEMASPDSAKLLARRLPKGQLHERERGGHHLVYLDETFRAEVIRFLRRQGGIPADPLGRLFQPALQA